MKSASSAASMSRRRLLLALLGSVALPRLVVAGPDQGIGGTGAHLRPVDEDADRGIGGTGVIGTIRKFGSIVVNDLRIAYPANAAVFIDGQPGTPAALAIGQVVRLVAHRDQDGLSTRTIDVSSEVVGPVERIGPKSLTVLGQSVSTKTLKGATPFAKGDHVAVSGLRRTDGTIVASLIERRDGSLFKVAGPVAQTSDGGLRIGGLRVTGVGGDLIGQRAIVIGVLQDRAFTVTRSTSETALFPGDVTRLSVEAYVARRGRRLTLGSGLAVDGTVASLPEGRGQRAVLNTAIGADGRLDVRSVRSDGARYEATPRDGGGSTRDGLSGRGPGGTRPMDFGRPSDGGLNSGHDLNGRTGGPPGSNLGSPAPGGAGLGGSGLGGPGLGGAGLPGLGGKGRR